MQQRNYVVISVLACTPLLLTGCGDSDSKADSSSSSYSASAAKRFSAEQISSTLSDLAINVSPAQLQYDVQTYRFIYQTIDGKQQKVTASGLIAIPQKVVGAKSPLMSFQHGTIFYDREAPSNDLNPDAPPIVLAALGYVIVAPDYVGYGASRGIPHPYLLAEPSAAATTDLIRAAKSWLNEQRYALNGQLFLTGYSEGGYVTMAAQQSLEKKPIPELQLIASIPAAGPYNVSATLESFVSLSLKSPTTAKTTELSPPLSDALTDVVMDHLIPDDADVVFEDTIIRNYLRNGKAGVAMHNVYDWRSQHKTYLFHGRDDQTVPFFNATDAYNAMTAKGSIEVNIVECQSIPSSHSKCVADYGEFLGIYLQNLARDL